MKKDKYIKMELDIVEFPQEDVVCSSGRVLKNGKLVEVEGDYDEDAEA